MTFDSVVFWLFLPLAWIAWRGLPFGMARTALVILSLVFYAWWNPAYVLLILASAAIDYRIGAALAATDDARRRKRLVTLSVVLNLGLLGVFKYTPMIARTAGALGGFAPDPDFLESWIVPVGISFFTFQTLSYSIDLYRRRVDPAQSFRDFLLYVAFFPQLVAGPIVRARTFLPQLEHRAPLSALRIRYGAYRCIEGLFLKIVVADGLAPAVSQGFDQTAAALSPVGAWYSAVLFGGQIFADFAGYTGIAIGVACLLGLRFPENFRAPYLSTSLSEFWSRWHISLSTWLRDYLYVPLGGNRKGRIRTYVNLMLVMLLGGLWHGASWSFVIWGGLHGGALALVRAVSSWRKRPLPGWARVFAGVAVFGFVQVTWVFFRAQDLETARAIAHAMLVDPFKVLAGGDMSVGTRSPSWRFAVLLVPIAVMHLAQWLHERFSIPRSELLRAIAAGLMLFAITVFRRSEVYQFIYFQF
ncbi:Peptidoglycan O-acetyltransferase [Planctomycetes bacterium Poly30]|uniref:Peptidoglycan O-acetyltransferase n=1 Tax=Saltatorellus ferox TaxID=2528018 RepID=A0A518EPV9_9BACT|nr:Peptidoglycan O-acetyltransferase [Planctomycetes bacterium Poly30]